MNRTPADMLVCPYCDRPLRWVPQRWFGRGCFECDQCGEFPDLRDTTRSRNIPYPYEQDAARRLPKHGGRPRILLVDDSVEHCDLYALMLEPTATVVTASRGEDALVIAGAEPLDAIVLDVLMPGMDGWEVCGRLKANPRTRDIPVILLTSLDGADLRARANQAGVAAVLLKPCAIERLALAIDAAVPRPATPVDQISGTTAPAAVQAAHTRRWTRKLVKAELPTLLDRVPAHLLNISYGGLCVQIEGASIVIPPSFDVTFPSTNFSVQAGAVWMSRGRGSWLCGAEVPHGNKKWRGLVDAVS